MLADLCYNCGAAPCDQDCLPPRPIVHRLVDWDGDPVLERYYGSVCGAFSRDTPPSSDTATIMPSSVSCPDCLEQTPLRQWQAMLNRVVAVLPRLPHYQDDPKIIALADDLKLAQQRMADLTPADYPPYQPGV